VIPVVLLSAAACAAVAPAAGIAKTSAHASAKKKGPKKGAGLVGTTSQSAGAVNYPADLRVSANGKSISRFDLHWVTQCQTSAGATSTFDGLSITLNKPISSKGSFGDSGSFTRNLGAGNSALYVVAVTGQFHSPTAVSGTFRLTITVTDATHTTIQTCASGAVSWSASD
jgi:hypothetical protein